MNLNFENPKFAHFTSQLIDLALEEDLGKPYCDVTTQTLFQNNHNKYFAKIISKHFEPVKICGLPLIQNILNKLSPHFDLTDHYSDGQWLPPGETLITLSSTAETLLMAERTILNFLRHLCAIATVTAKYVQAVNGYPLKILDTRKTMPGFRLLEKYAVHCGGGMNHREGLYDAILVKDTHVDLLGGMSTTLKHLLANYSVDYPIIVEVRNLEELKIVLEEGHEKINRVLLDNMSFELMTECVELCRNKIQTEASGNINLDNIASIAKTGVNFASVGALTHSAGNVDLSMRCGIQ